MTNAFLDDKFLMDFNETNQECYFLRMRVECTLDLLASFKCTIYMVAMHPVIIDNKLSVN